MDVNIVTTIDGDCLMIKSSGSAVELEDYKLLQERYYNEIVKYGFTTIIVDESRMQLPASLLAQDEIVKFFSDELPEEIKAWKIAAVLPAGYIDIARYWELQANKHGYSYYKVFISVDDAMAYIQR